MRNYADIPYERDPLQSHEACDWGTDPLSGAEVTRLTSAISMSHNIYCEQPYGSTDGKRLLIDRFQDFFKSDHQLIIADLEALRLTLVEETIAHGSIAHSSWSEWAYYPARTI